LFTGGLAGSASAITGSVGKALSFLSIDADYKQVRQSTSHDYLYNWVKFCCENKC